MSIWFERLMGVLLLGGGLTVFLANFSHLVPDTAGQYISLQVRIFEHLRPYLAIASLGFAVLFLLLGHKGFAALSLAGALAAAISLALDYRARALPFVEAEPDLTLLWFNMLEKNKIPPERLAKALSDSGADVIALGESRPAAALPDLLQEEFPYRVGCEDERACGLLLLSRFPLSTTALRDLPSGPERLIRTQVSVPERIPFRLVVAHLVKPWFTAMALTEEQALFATLGGKSTAPSVVIGDLNAAPWSLRLRDLETKQRLLHAPRPVATWPVEAGNWGVPIDHLLLRDGARLVSLEPWGDNLGSNHRGLLAKLTLPAAED